MMQKKDTEKAENSESSVSEEEGQKQEEQAKGSIPLITPLIAPEPPPMPGKVGEQEDLTPDGGVSKTVLEVGENTAQPATPSLVTVIYKGYFKKSKVVFDSSDGKPVQLELGDPAKIEGFHIAIEHMFKGEKAEFLIHSDYAFRKDRAGVVLPAGFEGKRELLRKKRVIYEIKLLDFVARVDLDKDKRLIKTIEKQGTGKRTPKELDDVKINFEVKQEGQTKAKKEGWLTAVDSDDLALCMKKFLISLKLHEKSFCDIKSEFLLKNEKEYCEKFSLNPAKDLQVHIELLNFIRVEDYYHDDSTLRKIFSHGAKETNPYIESTVECKVSAAPSDSQDEVHRQRRAQVLQSRPETAGAGPQAGLPHDVRRRGVEAAAGQSANPPVQVGRISAATNAHPQLARNGPRRDHRDCHNSGRKAGFLFRGRTAGQPGMDEERRQGAHIPSPRQH